VAQLRFELKGEPSSIGLKAFATAVSNWLRVLADIDSAISGEPNGSLEWVVSDLKIGSLSISAEARSLKEGRNVAPDVSRAFVHGFRILENEGSTPPYLSENGMKNSKTILRLIGRDGVAGFRVGYQNEDIELSARASANIDQLLPARRHSLGSVEGKLEMINLHGKVPRFIVYHHRTHKAVTCKFSTDRLVEVKEALGKRVIISGSVQYNGKGEPLRVALDHMRVLRSNSELPTISQMRGYAPNLTGEMTTAEYMRSIRGD